MYSELAQGGIADAQEFRKRIEYLKAQALRKAQVKVSEMAAQIASLL